MANLLTLTISFHVGRSRLHTVNHLRHLVMPLQVSFFFCANKGSNAHDFSGVT